MNGGNSGLPALQVPSSQSQQQPSSANTQPQPDNKIKMQHPQHHSIGAASVLSPKGSMGNKDGKHPDVTSLESFRPNRGAQPMGLVQQTSPYPSFI